MRCVFCGEPATWEWKPRMKGRLIYGTRRLPLCDPHILRLYISQAVG